MRGRKRVSSKMHPLRRLSRDHDRLTDASSSDARTILCWIDMASRRSRYRRTPPSPGSRGWTTTFIVNVVPHPDGRRKFYLPVCDPLLASEGEDSGGKGYASVTTTPMLRSVWWRSAPPRSAKQLSTGFSLSKPVENRLFHLIYRSTAQPGKSVQCARRASRAVAFRCA